MISSLSWKGVIALLAAVVLSGCVTTSDSIGRIYPEVCRGPLTCEGEKCTLAGKTLIVASLAPEKMPKAPDGRPHLGYYYWGSDSVQILERLSGHLKNDIIRHEICHAIAGAWHR